MPQGRTPLFRKLLQATRQAHWLNQNPQHRTIFFEAKEAARISRRDFVRMLSAAGLMTAAGGLSPRSLRGAASPSPRRSNDDPVAIIGAGAAGLTAAYRLHKAGVPCEIFEASNRTGGRIFTRHDFNREGMFCEMGGELVDSDHADLIALAGELGLEIQDLKKGDQGVDLYFFGGKHCTDEQLIPLFQPFAKKLAADAEGLYDADENFTGKAKAFDQMNLAAYLAETGRAVDQWIVDLLRVAYITEYGRELADQSALNLITYLDPDTSAGFRLFGASDESKRIKGGNSSLPDALVHELRGKVKIRYGHRLVRIEQAGARIGLHFTTDGKTRSAKFTRVICAAPFTMLRQIQGVRELPLSAEKQKAIAEFGYGNNSKVMSGFTERWWRNPAVKLPAPSNGSTFTDLIYQCTWETSRGQEGAHGILTNFLGGAPAGQLTAERYATFQQELGRVFPGIENKFDGRRATMNWPKYPFVQGSYSCPLVGQFTTLLAAAAVPELDGRLIFAGEHTSADFSGFMNGAVESGNRAAREILGSGKSELKKAA